MNYGSNTPHAEKLVAHWLRESEHEGFNDIKDEQPEPEWIERRSKHSLKHAIHLANVNEGEAVVEREHAEEHIIVHSKENEETPYIVQLYGYTSKGGTLKRPELLPARETVALGTKYDCRPLRNK